MSDNIPIFCLNMKSSTQRKERMQKRFQLHNLTPYVTYIDGITANSTLVDYYLQDMDADVLCNIYFSVNQARKDAACFATHIKAVRTFLEMSGKDGCIICEDDILFHNDFQVLLQDIMENVPADIPCISFSWMISDAIDQTFVGINPEKENLWNINPHVTWGAQCYYISTEYALKVIHHYDHEFWMLRTVFNRNKITSEIIIQLSEGYMVSHPLVIEDCIDSDRAPQDLAFHARHWIYWRYKNFTTSDPEQLSPLKYMSKADAWEKYPFNEADLYTGLCVESDSDDELTDENDSDYNSESSAESNLENKL